METTSNLSNTWQVYGGRIYRASNEELIIDTETSLEDALSRFGWTGILCASIVLFFDFSTGDLMMADNTSQRLLCYFVAFGFSALLLLVRSQLEDDYIIDLKSKQILFKRTLFGKSNLKTVCQLHEIETLYINAKYHKSKSRSDRTYRLDLLCIDGRVIKLLPPVLGKSYEDVHADGEQLAEILSLKFRAGGPKGYARIKKTHYGATIEFD